VDADSGQARAEFTCVHRAMSPASAQQPACNRCHARPLNALQVDVTDGRADALKKNSFEMTGDKSDQDSWVKMAQNSEPPPSVLPVACSAAQNSLNFWSATPYTARVCLLAGAHMRGAGFTVRHGTAGIAVAVAIAVVAERWHRRPDPLILPAMACL
jgi:hypothetical protein